MKNHLRWAGSSRPDTGHGSLLPRCLGESVGQPPAAVSCGRASQEAGRASEIA
jgi:hypothetical protein